MEEIVAYCGLTCSECPAYLATQANSDADRRSVAAKWSQDYGSDIKPDQINCDGCLPGQGRYFSHCAVCDIRACGVARGVKNCAHCEDYGCEKLTRFFGLVPAAKAKLDGLRSGL
ncbi:MAG: DUF3795 domain-containing protein [Anaerolineae bacterium]|nr:DUF3795 domain-containing protein [Anaerolineae bacterium]